MEVKFYKGGSEDAFYVRRKVFIEEQEISENAEFDGSDEGTTQAVVYCEGTPVATGRLIQEGSEMRIGRVAVLKDFRKRGAGRKVITALEKKAVEMGIKEIYIHAQTQAEGFYTALGYTPYGEVFLEEGISHISMKKIIAF